MNLHAAQNLARQLIKQHGLAGWTFSFDHARRRFGSCRVKSKMITLSRTLTFLNPETEVRDTILHEIAHALTPNDGHGQRWKRKCIEIGARPERCYAESKVVTPARPTARYAIGCRTCGWWADRRRLIRRQLICKICRSPVVYRERLTGKEFTLKVG
jgi:predicted SprT family Zn-dependent metalloprotease